MRTESLVACLPLVIVACSGGLSSVDGPAPDGRPPSAAGSPSAETERPANVSFISRATAEEIRALYPNQAPYIQNGISGYRVVYSQPYKGGSIRVSGALLVPDSAKVKSIVSFNHFTIFESERLPGNVTADSQVNFLFGGPILAASHGYVVIAPDYPGYGEDAERQHPYQIAEPLVDSVLSLANVATQHLAEQNKPHDGKLFLVGFSEGAYVSLATHQALEARSFPLALGGTVACAPCIQGSVLAAKLFATDKTPIESPATIAFAIQGYDAYYDLKQPSSHYFTSPNARKLDSGLLRTATWTDANAALDHTPGTLFTPTFLGDFRDGRSAFASRLKENDRAEWKPRAPVHVVAGAKDGTCPAFQSQAFYAFNQDNPAVTLSIAPGGHDSLLDPHCGTDAIDRLDRWRQ